MGAITEAAAMPLVIDLTSRDGFDPSLLHYWERRGPTGEWPRIVVFPVCTPSISRDIHPDVTAEDMGVDPYDYDVCPVCAEVAAALEARAEARP